MKSRISRHLLEDALARCYDACEKKASESMIKLVFDSSHILLQTKGSFTFYEEKIPLISCDESVSFCLRTHTLLEFVKHIGSDNLILAHDLEKNTCLVSSEDKKSKIALVPVDVDINLGQIDNYNIKFDIENSMDFIGKLIHAAKFCSINFQDHPLTGIYCHSSYDKFEIKSTNGPMFYGTSLEIKSPDTIDIFLPKKAPAIIKNIFDSTSGVLKSCSLNKRSMQLESDNCKLIIHIESDAGTSFPDQIVEWTEKESVASIKVSTYELAKSLKYFAGIFSETSVNFSVKDTLTLEAKENSIAAKESVLVEEISGEASSAYNAKYFLDCIDSIQSSWIKVDFIKMKDDFCLCKLTAQNTLVLLCPTTF